MSAARRDGPSGSAIRLGVVLAVRGMIALLVGALVWAGVTAYRVDARGSVGAAVAPGVAPEPVAPTGVGDVTGLSPSLRRAVHSATVAAAADGVTLVVTSGFRPADHQQRLFDEAVAKYGSVAEARAWVLPPTESEHVQGRAVDVGPPSAAAWLEAHGVGYGLCRRYDNEPWHFERLAGALGSICPAREASAAG